MACVCVMNASSVRLPIVNHIVWTVVRLQMLEESLRDVELRAAQQLTEEQRRNKELIVRVEREKQLEIENCTIK